MSSLSTSAPAAPIGSSLPEPSLLQVVVASLRSEWSKLRSVRSTMWSLLVTLGITVGLGSLFAAARVSRWDRLDRVEFRSFDAAGFTMNGLFLAQLAIGVLGVLVVTSEYATGQIRATFGATPQRLVVLAAKTAVFFVVNFVVGFIGCFLAFTFGQAILGNKMIPALRGSPAHLARVTLGDPGVLRAVIGGGLYLAVLGVMGIALGTILRRTAGAIATLVGILLILPILVRFLPSPWNDDIGKYLPGEAGGNIFHTVQSANSLSPWSGFALFVAYAAGLMIIAAVLLVRRDA